MIKLSVVLATRNEELNIGCCLESVKAIADEIVIADEHSTDRTREIAKKYGARVFEVEHEPIFHKTKEKALEAATGDWILQLDADESVSPQLASEIRSVTKMGDEEIKKREPGDSKSLKLFKKHQKLIEERDGKIGRKTGEVVGFFIPRRNYFLGKPLKYGGTYPDGVIRLVKRGKAYFPGKSVHEQIRLEGEVAWLFSDLEHYDTPNLSKYFWRMNRYTNLKTAEFQEANVPKNVFVLFYYSFLKPLAIFLTLYIRHKGILDGARGFLWSLFSALHYPIAYFKYLNGEQK